MESWVFPQRASLHIRAGDFSQEIEEREEAASDAGLGGLNLLLLAPQVPAPLSVETISSERLNSENRVASTDSAQLMSLDLSSAEPEDAMPSRKPFRLELHNDRCVTALLLELRLDLGEATSPSPVQTVLHLPPASGASHCRRFRGSEFQALEGYFSAGPTSDEGGGLEIAVSLTAIRRDGDVATLSSTFQIPPI